MSEPELKEALGMGLYNELALQGRRAAENALAQLKRLHAEQDAQKGE